ncbi:MAG: hypothetical protein WED09_00935 [Homoserinimonas sp.]
MGLDAAAQLRIRAQLLTGFAEAARRRDESRARREQTAEQIRSQLVADVSVATTMVIGEIRLALDAGKHQLNAHRIELVGDRVAEVSAQVRQAIGRLSDVPDDLRPSAAPTAAPMAAALDFQREHPWRWSVLSAAALAAVLLPIAYHFGGMPLLTALALSLTVIALVLGLTASYGPSRTSTSPQVVAVWPVARYAAAGLAGSCVLAASPWSELGTFSIVLLVALPWAAAVSAEILSRTVGVAEANRQVLTSIAELDAQRHQLDVTALENENRIRQELYEVMHGPILGRLSSCAMALNFLAAEADTASSDRITTVTTAVLDHLNQTMDDLGLLKT